MYLWRIWGVRKNKIAKILKLKFFFIGKTKEKFFQEAEEKFLKYLKKFCQTEVKIFPEETKWEIEKQKNLESEKILRNISEKNFVILLDVYWKTLSSEEFAEKLDKIFSLWKEVVFVVSWSYWPNEELRKRADLKLSLSKMTFTHQMIRQFLFEQIFRAFSILHWSDYHK